MNNWELADILKRNPSTSRIFAGVYPVDLVPLNPNSCRPCAYVVNTHPHFNPGEHWLCVYFPRSARDPTEYYDSYGLPPRGDFKKLLGQTYIYSRSHLQHPLSTACGQYCVFFIHQRSKGKNMQEIIDTFKDNEDLWQNDVMVNKYVERHFNVDLNIVDVKYISEQIGKYLS